MKITVFATVCDYLSIQVCHLSFPLVTVCNSLTVDLHHAFTSQCFGGEFYSFYCLIDSCHSPFPAPLSLRSEQTQVTSPQASHQLILCHYPPLSPPSKQNKHFALF